MLTIGSLFAGIGGLELGLEATGGFRTTWQVEIDEYARRVLAKHWPDIARYRDVRDVHGACGQGCDYCLCGVDVLIGGFPCQDVSLAGAQLGLDGKRSTLWSEFARIIRELRPRWVVAENVPGLLSANDGRFFGRVLRDLAEAGYDAEWGVLSAAAMGAPHRRDRVFVIAHSRGPIERRGQQSQWQQDQRDSDTARDGTEGTALAHAASSRLEGAESAGKTRAERLPAECGEMADSTGRGFAMLGRASGQRRYPVWGDLQAGAGRAPSGSTQRELGGATHGLPEGLDGPWGDGWERDTPRVAVDVPERVARLRCLGNAVVPQCAMVIGKMILDAEEAS